MAERNEESDAIARCQANASIGSSRDGLRMVWGEDDGPAVQNGMPSAGAGTRVYDVSREEALRIMGMVAEETESKMEALVALREREDHHNRAEDESRDRASEQIGQLLLAGHTMLSEVCSRCNTTPLMAPPAPPGTVAQGKCVLCDGDRAAGTERAREAQSGRAANDSRLNDVASAATANGREAPSLDLVRNGQNDTPGMLSVRTREAPSVDLVRNEPSDTPSTLPVRAATPYMPPPSTVPAGPPRRPPAAQAFGYAMPDPQSESDAAAEASVSLLASRSQNAIMNTMEQLTQRLTRLQIAPAERFRARELEDVSALMHAIGSSADALRSLAVLRKSIGGVPSEEAM